MKEPILTVDGLKKYFPIFGGIFLQRRGWVYAVDDVSFELFPGETLGIVGESGCGKTTLGRCIAGLYPLTSGNVLFCGENFAGQERNQIKKMRLNLQMIFQDPFESLNSRHTVGEILEEKYLIHGRTKEKNEIATLLGRVGLSSRAVTKFPHEFSGGQRQRIGIARAISLNPRLIICDEPVSALDVSVQSQILNLLLELQEDMGLTYLFISHDLAVVRHVSDRIVVMYLGRIVEIAHTREIYNTPAHPYTRALLSAIPIPDPALTKTRKERIMLKGEVPSPSNPPGGCRFHTRCPKAQPICRKEEPLLRPMGEEGHLAACHFTIH